ncbi:glutamate receptor ionotropic, kainate 2 isoform X2 [Eurytemora carolleeae]|uniref:glutamate receptor ionotropic, kainate 2 isoform X2 n=1 Tax=Eurytemora carolleeae TaxID=1294199 RepID=UPI000C78A8D0|nr:glutamate receptor ionotropic, kainate 2 isoform X2 [Eurytemora carolleeae]|eukprot:XP_023322918.1 glutamate receptor ionotropic, kainate 2-like isoform X2 [Eurytemora affinis]
MRLLFIMVNLLIRANVDARMNSTGILEQVHNLYTSHSWLFLSVVNLILCDDLDELVAGALSLHYSTFSQLNLKPNKIKNFSALNLDGSAIIFCKLPAEVEMKVNEAHAFFLTDNEQFVKRFLMDGQENKKFLVKNNSEVFEVKTIQSVYNSITINIPISHGQVETRFDGEVFDGSIGGIFHTMSTLMNFTYSSIPSIDGFYGAKVPGGVINRGKVSQFNGLIGMLERGEIDVAVTDLSLTYARKQVADFGGKMILQSTMCLMAKPGTELEFTAFFKPLKPMIWVYVFCSAGGLSLFLLLLAIFSYKQTSVLEQGSLVLDLVGFSLRTLGAAETFLLPEKRFKKAWRVCMLTYLILGFFVVETYKAELTSYLTSKTAKLPIQRMEDILDTDIKLSLPAGSFYVTELEFSEKAIFKRLWDEKVTGNQYGIIKWGEGETETILTAIRNNYLVLGFGDDALNLIDKYPCEVARIAEDPVLPTQIGIYLSKNSPFTHLFQKQLSVLQETGVVNTIIEKSKSGNQGTATCNNSNLILGIQSTVFLFLVVGVGVVLSCFIFIVEFILFAVQPFI